MSSDPWTIEWWTWNQAQREYTHPFGDEYHNWVDTGTAYGWGDHE